MDAKTAAMVALGLKPYLSLSCIRIGEKVRWCVKDKRTDELTGKGEIGLEEWRKLLLEEIKEPTE